MQILKQAEQWPFRCAERADAYDLDRRDPLGPDQTPVLPGPWFHGSDHELKPGDIVRPGYEPTKWNYSGDGNPRHNWVFMTQHPGAARFWAPHVYRVEPLEEGPYPYNGPDDYQGDGYVSPAARVVEAIPGGFDAMQAYADRMGIGDRTGAVNHKTAMPAPTPQGLTFKRHYNSDTLMDAIGDYEEAPAITAHIGDCPRAIGHLGWFGVDSGYPKGMVRWIHVDPDFRHHNIATAMFDYAKTIEPDLHHSDSRTPSGKGWVEYEQSRHHTAMPAPTPKLDITHKDYGDGGGMVEARSPGAQHNWKGGKNLVGYLQYNPDGEIVYVETHPDYRRHGIADAMYDYADQFVQNLHHSRERTGLGDLWAEHERTR